MRLDNFAQRLYALVDNETWEKEQEKLSQGALLRLFAPSLSNLPVDFEEQGVLSFNQTSQKFEFVNFKAHELMKPEKFWIFEGVKHFNYDNKTFMLAQVNTELPGSKSIWLPIIVTTDK